MPAAVAIPAAVSAGSSIFGGIMGSRASSKAAAQQAAAAERAGQLVVDTANRVNPTIAAAADKGIAGMNDAVTGAQGGMNTAADAAQQGMAGAVTTANNFLDPYRAAGDQATTTLSGLMQPGGELNRKFNLQDFQELDPGFGARLAEANRALQYSQAARGNSISGAALKELSQFNQNYASSEIGNAFGRFQQQN